MKIAITGTMGSGKSTCSQLLREAGYFVADADQISHDLLLPGQKGYMPVTCAFSGILNEQKEIDRALLAKTVFQNTENRIRLEKILHPLIQAEMMNQLNQHTGLVFAEVPLLYEAGMEDLFDAVVVVDAHPDVRMERLQAYRNITAEEAQKRIKSQFSDEEKRKKADYVIDNHGSKIDLQLQLDRLLKLWEEH